MKIILILFFMAFRIFSQDDFESLLKLHQNKDLFSFISISEKNNLNLNDWQKKYVQALSLNLKNKNNESNELIKEILSDNSATTADSLKKMLYEVRLKNSVHLSDYSDAFYCSVFITDNFRSLLDSNELFDLENSQKIWKAAQLPDKQKALITGDSKIPISRDLAGLVNISVSCGGEDEDFIFDTGANFSVVNRSTAVKMKLKILEGTIEVGAITGKKITSQLAVAEKLIIGDITFYNVVFLVMPDEALSFAGGLYTIKGVIGLPVIKAMKEVHIRKNEIFIPVKPASVNFSNLLIDGFVMVINIVNKGDSLAFTFDTGAKKTILYSSFYQKYKKDIDSKYELKEIELGGAGGTVKVKGFKIDDIAFNIGSSKLKLEDISLVSENIKDHDKGYFGNLGQDYMGEFSEMIMNFEDMYVDFK